MKNISIVIFLLAALFAFSTIIIVDETEQIVILQFGKPVRTIKEAGLNWKLPAPFQTSNSFEKRLLEYDVPPEEILSKDKKSLKKVLSGELALMSCLLVVALFNTFNAGTIVDGGPPPPFWIVLISNPLLCIYGLNKVNK